MTVDVKYLKHQIFVAALTWFPLVVYSLLTQGWDGSHWWRISTKIKDLMIGPIETFKLDLKLLVLL